MTKPSYEELEGNVEALANALLASEAQTEAAQTSLARVRGLLQRLLLVEELFNVHFFAGESVGAAIKRELGAESADIGKLDTADKSELLPTQLPKEK